LLPPVPRYHTLYLPLVSMPPADSRVSLSWFASNDCCAEQSAILKLSAVGYNYDFLDPANDVQVFNYTFLSHEPCSYDIAAHVILDRVGCADWIKWNYLGGAWIIGNEPDFMGVTMQDYVQMYHDVKHFLAEVDPAATLILTAWAGHDWHATTGLFIQAYRGTYNEEADPDYWNLHLYHYAGWDSTADRAIVTEFASHLQGQVFWLGEFGWNWADSTTPAETRIKYIQDFIPWLLAQPQMGKMFWWRDSGALVSGGQMTALGQCYSALAHGGRCD